MQLNYLEWDSKFFERRIFSCTINGNEDVDLAKEELRKRNANLCYFFSKEYLNLTKSDSFFLADSKVVFYKNKFPSQREVLNDYIKSTKSFTVQLYNLALLSGQHSRFRTDKSLSTKFSLMYRTWLKKSLARKMASEVFVYEKDNEQLGFVTIKKENDEAVVGLIAVKQEAQGREIGTSLLRKIECWCMENKIATLEIATQMDNKQACSFYTKNGYEIKQIEYIYHCYLQ